MKKDALKNYVPELLAPAGSFEAFIAAVNAGADAVYLSGKKFGARKFADNFSESEIVKSLNYAKLRGVKVYVTVNTLIKDSQIKEVVEYLIRLYEIGVDAVIIQDLGVASLSKEVVPDLEIHASTQMTIHNVNGVEWASKFGFKRVVLSRELGISEVKEIVTVASELGIEVEIFGHGALCYSYSGMCLMSSFIGGRSGNRGMCAQPCRKEYVLVGGKSDEYGRPLDLHKLDLKDRYLLSTRDLSLYKYLKTFTNLGIDSLKIEGRMRSAEYVATVISIYKKAFETMNPAWMPDPVEISRLKLAFNRGFTGGYIAEPSTVMGCDAPGNRGLYMGDVIKYDEKRHTVIVGLKNKFKLGKGDGIVFRSLYNENFSIGHQNFGMVLDEDPDYKSGKLYLRSFKPVPTGSKMYLTRSIALSREAKSIIKKVEDPSIPLDVDMSWDDQLRAELNGRFNGFDGKTHCVNFKSQHPMEKAMKKPLEIGHIEKQLKKTGDTPFKMRNVSINYPGDLFTPISKLNSLRREFLLKTESELLSSYRPSKLKVKDALNRFKHMNSPDDELCDEVSKVKLSVYTDNLEAVKGALNGGCKRIYYEPGISKINISVNCYKPGSDIDLIKSDLIEAEDLCRKHGADLIWKWPQITTQNEINQYINLLKSFNRLDGIMVDGLGAGFKIKNIEEKINIFGSAGLNIWNVQTVKELSNTFDLLTPSPELSKEDLRSLISISRSKGVVTDFEIVVQGNADTLISKDCILSPIHNDEMLDNQFMGIQDNMKRVFPIKMDQEGHTHILNSVELCLIDHLPELIDLGINSVIVDARIKTYDYARDMISIYHEGIKQVNKGVLTKRKINMLKSKIKKISTGGITSGSFLQGTN